MQKNETRNIMKELTVNIYPLRNGEFLTSYAHPLTKRKFRNRFATRDEAKVHKESVESKFNRKNAANYQDLNLEELLLLYLHENPKSDLNYNKKGLVRDFLDTFSEFSAAEITTDSMKIWLDQQQRERNLKTVTMRSIEAQLNRFYKYLIDKNVISESPVATINYEWSRPSIKEKNILTEQQIENLLTAIKGYSPGYLYPLIRTFAETGVKTMEAMEITWNDVDLENGTIRFPKTIASQERKIKISEELKDLLNQKKKKQGYVFVTYFGNQFTKHSIRRAVDEFKSKGLYQGDWNPLDLRHSFAANFLLKFGDLKKLQYLMGHSLVHDTRKLYGEVLQNKIQSDPQISEINLHTDFHS